MSREDPHVVGALSEHPAAAGLAREVRRVHHRYANEVVKAFRLCPFPRAAGSGFGPFCAAVDRELAAATALAASLPAPGAVVHLVYPMALPPPRTFEGFASALPAELKKALPHPPVYAA